MQTNTNITQTNTTTKKVINYKEYDSALENRGNFTVLLNTAYLNSVPTRTGKAGHPTEYADAVILFVAQIREFMRLPIRQAKGNAKFIVNLAGLDLKIPSRTTISRRLGELKIPTNLRASQYNSPIVFLPDSTGLKTSGEGEWKVRKHGADKRRGWVKLHIGVDHKTQTIVAVTTSSSDAHDGRFLPRLLSSAKKNCGHGKGKKIIGEVVADGAYGSHSIYERVESSGANLLVPPQTNATVHYDVEGNARTGKITDSPGWKTRNRHIWTIKEVGMAEWKRRTGYHRRSLAETAMFRLKRTFGGELKSRLRKNQIAEINIRISLLNMFTGYGLPRYSG